MKNRVKLHCTINIELMKRNLTSMVVFLLALTMYGQEGCVKPFERIINYENEELGLNYNNFKTIVEYQIFQRTNEEVDTRCIKDVYDFKKPILIVEGYDIFHKENTKNIYDHYINSDEGGLLGTQLRAEGYDIITLNLSNPQEAIQLNALILEQLITHLNEKKSSDEKLIIMGVSLGGVITRYALADMEAKGINHETKLYVSFDSPHKGAYVPLSIQALFRYVLLSAALFDPRANYLYQTYINDGSQQLLKNNLFYTKGGETEPDPRHISFYEELRSLGNCNGYPKVTKNIAISNGTLKGYPNSCVSKECPGGTALVLGIGAGPINQVYQLTAAPGNFSFGEDKSCFFYKNEPFDVDPDLYLNVGTLPYEHLPGGYYSWYNEIKKQWLEINGTDVYYSFYEKASFISTISALDLSTDDPLLNLSSYGKEQVLANSPFDDIWWDVNQENLVHAEMTLGMANWLHDQIHEMEATPDSDALFFDKTLQGLNILNGFESHKAVNELVVEGNSKVYNGGELALYSEKNIMIKPNSFFEKGSRLSTSIQEMENTYSDCTVLDNLPHLNMANFRESSIQMEEASLESISLFPNPVVDFLTINSDKEIYKLTIIDFVGDVVVDMNFESGEKVMEINLSNLQHGEYILHLVLQNEMTRQRIYKN